MTDAGLLVPAMLIVMALVECEIWLRSLNGRFAQIVIATALTGFYIWADTEYRAEQRQYERVTSTHCKAGPDVVCFDFPYYVSPQILDALAVHVPAVAAAWLVSAPAGLSSDSTAIIVLSYLTVWIYWFTLISLVGGRWPATTRAYCAIRPWLIGLFVVVFGFALLGWILATSVHGPTGVLGIVVGAGGVIYALHASQGKARLSA